MTRTISDSDYDIMVIVPDDAPPERWRETEDSNQLPNSVGEDQAA
jgi:hypothetical protein